MQTDDILQVGMSKENRAHSQALIPRIASLSLVSIMSSTKAHQEDL